MEGAFMSETLQVEQRCEPWRVKITNTPPLYAKLSKKQAHLIATFLTEKGKNWDEGSAWWDRQVAAKFLLDFGFAHDVTGFGDKRWPTIIPVHSGFTYDEVFNSWRPKFWTTAKVQVCVTFTAVIVSIASVLIGYYQQKISVDKIDALSQRVKLLESLNAA